jgi:hypothetical protein
MAIFCLAFELGGAKNAYHKLWQVLQAPGVAYFVVEPSVWFVQSYSSADAVSEFVRTMLGARDEVRVWPANQQTWEMLVKLFRLHRRSTWSDMCRWIEAITRNEALERTVEFDVNAMLQFNVNAMLLGGLMQPPSPPPDDLRGGQRPPWYPPDDPWPPPPPWK